MKHRRRSDPPAAPSAELAGAGDTSSRKPPGLALDLARCGTYTGCIRCDRHGHQPTGYWICKHIELYGTPVSFRMPAAGDSHGALLCQDCKDRNVRKLIDTSTVRTVCLVCLYAAGLIDSPEVKP